MNKNYMNNFIKILILPIAIITMFGCFTPKVFAVVAPLSVQFVPDPLFTKPNFLPLDETSGTVTITNNSDATQTILTEANHVVDNDHFGNLLNLKINNEDSVILFDNTLAYFFTTAGEYSLGTIASGETKTFTYTVSFIDSSDNSYQGKTLGFDVCVGFQGGNATNCGNTAIGNENGGGGGSSSGSMILIVFNEEANNITNVDNSGSAVIIWNTNKLATSQVIYGLTTGGPYTLNLNAPNFGYPFSNIEDPTKVIDHSMFIGNLIPGQTYSYRVVSKASPATVSFEHEFVVPLLLAQAGEETNLINIENGKVLGASDENVLGENKETATVAPLDNLVTTITSGFKNLSSVCYLLSLLILIIMLLTWLFFKRKYKKLGIQDEEIRNKFYLFFSRSSLIVILILLLINKYCPLIIFVIVFILSICFYTYRKLKIK